MGYYRAGFDEIVGVDIRRQPRYPFRLVLGDALRPPVRLEDFDVIHASPPCQLWADGTPDRSIWSDLITPLRPLLLASERPYVIENVRRAPLLNPIQICGGGLGLTYGDYQLHRHRRFESNLPLFGVPCARWKKLTLSVVGHGTPSGMRRKDRPDPTIADRRAIMGVDWTTRNELSESIPPAYTEFIGHQLLDQLNRGAA